MTFEQAKKQLAKIAKGEYHSLNYGVDCFSKGNEKIECTVYINGIGMYASNTWNKAFKELRSAMRPRKAPIDPKEAPKDDKIKNKKCAK